MTEVHGAPFEVAWLVWGRVAIVMVVLCLAIVALLALRRRPMDEISRFLWSIFIVFAPVLGSVVFFIVRPGTLDSEARKTI